MKLYRFFALAAIALLVVGAMGALSTRAFALGSAAPVTRVSAQAQDCSQDQADGTEVQFAADTDNVDLQCGDQSAPDTVGAAEKSGQETVSAADTDNVNVEEQVGDQSGADGGVEAPEAASPSGK